MAFERLNIRGSAKHDQSLAHITLGYVGGSKLTSTVISLHRDLVAEAGFTSDTRLEVLIGTDDDAGKLRLVGDPAGRARMRTLKSTGAWFVNLGHVEAFGIERRKREGTSARVIARGAVEVDIPFIAAAAAANEAKPIAQEILAAAIEAPPADVETINGIVFNRAPGAESVMFRERGQVLSPQQLKFVALLARTRPHPIAEKFLIEKLWDGAAPARAANKIEAMVLTLKPLLVRVGLDLRKVNGVGYQLQDI
jgi:hypothetical protein